MRPQLIRQGETAPDFALPAIDNTVWRGSDLLRGGRTVLLFFRRDCPASRLVLGFLERSYRRLQQAGLRVGGIRQDSHPDTLELADAYQITFPLLLDHPRLAVSGLYGVSHVPSQVMCDPQGTVLATVVGFSRWDQEQVFLRLARELSRAEDRLFHERDMVPETVAPWPSASAEAGP